ncbi:uncharacterized protein N7482_006243 [Penicillium canariense]|uniref:NAD(P)-binding protein n=1 Tax=Penicillium canariense TaxID=189055 RepID=A0A9W9I9L4_9EURO|nr:uncharacterized protein N7482_006243 [Penicillium canariense]KAJ5167462.1 hypothetical protein N7482_006243 [Penicillium canariense]
MDISKWTTGLSWVGLAALSYLGFNITRQATVYLLPCRLSRYNRSGANWALVTGATDGIGFGFCEELCARGFNVILHGRNREKLERRMRDTRQGLSSLMLWARAKPVDGVAQQARGIIGAQGKLTVLVNNVGGEMRSPTTLDAYTYAEVDATIDRNARFMTHITRALLPLLSEGPGRSGLVLNVSAISQYGMPYISVYSATKGFVDSFTRALEAECNAEQRGVDVIGLRARQVKTARFDVETNLFVPLARPFAKAGLDRVGCGKVIVWAYFWHWVQGISFDILPRWMLMHITSKKLMALKKKEEKAFKSQ